MPIGKFCTTSLIIPAQNTKPYPNLSGFFNIQKKIKEIESDLTVGRVLIRPSGTENLIRVMVESESKETAQKYASDISKLFE